MSQINISSIAPIESRRAPRQQRAKITVDSIKEAVLELAQSYGFANITITQIAERSGVSKGSLYHYFSGKEAVYLAIFEDTCTEMSNRMKDTYVQMLDLPTKDGIALGLKNHLELILQNALVFLTLPAQMPDLCLTYRPITYENMISRFTRDYLKEICPHLSHDEIDCKAVFIREITRSCIYRFINDPPNHLSERVFLGELTYIISAYINKVET